MFFFIPQTFFFIVVYLLFVFFMFCTDRFFVFWSLIEIRTLVFIGVSYSFFKNNFSSLIIFFIIQAISAFSLLIFYCVSSGYIFTISLFLKLSIFPFFFWYINVAFSFPMFILFFSRTIFKIPAFSMANIFYGLLDYNLVFISIVLTIAVRALVIIFSNDLRMLLVSSSVVNNSWFFLSQYVSIHFFIIYFTVYSFFLACLILNSSTLFSIRNFRYNIKYDFLVILSLLTLAGLPPFPLFYVKLLVIFSVASYFFSYIFIMFVMLFTVISMLGYLKHVFTVIIINFSSSVFFIINNAQ